MKRLLLIILLINPFFVYAKEEVKFNKCIDGDTIKVERNDEIITVRLLAVNTPEIKTDKKEGEYYSEEASTYTCNLIMNAKKIELEYDPKSDITDKYDRTLAWVFIDGKLLEDLLVKNGYAEVKYVYDDYKYVDLLMESENIAKTNRLGIWNDYVVDDVEENIDNNIILIWSFILIIILITLLYLIKNILKKKHMNSKINHV